MPIVILPTAEIITRFKGFEELFGFYDDGLKGVIRDTILTSQAYDLVKRRYPTGHKNKCIIMASGLMDKILRDYHNSADAMFLHRIENTNAATYVEEAAILIDQAVHEMMRVLFAKIVYDMCMDGSVWLGDDLMTKVYTYCEEKKCAIGPNR